MNLLAAILLVSGAVALSVSAYVGLTLYLDGREARSESRRRNQAHRIDR